MLFEEAEQVGLFLRELIHLTLLRRFVRSPAEQLGAMAKTIAGHMIVANFDNEFRLERLPDIFLSLVPTARSPRGGAGEAGRGDESFEFFRQRRAVGGGDARGESDVVQQTHRVVETKEQRTDGLFAFAVTKSADDAIGGAEAFDLLHPVAFAGAVVEIASFRDDAVQSGRGLCEPILCFGEIWRRRRQTDPTPFNEKFSRKSSRCRRRSRKGSSSNDVRHRRREDRRQ